MINLLYGHYNLRACQNSKSYSDCFSSLFSSEIKPKMIFKSSFPKLKFTKISSISNEYLMGDMYVFLWTGVSL